MMADQVLVLVIAVLLTAGAGILGVTEALGTHPFWSVKVALIGAALGALIAAGIAAFGVRQRAVLVASALISLVAAAIAQLGKARFAASFAEDLVAGKLWYLGWIAALAAVCVLAQAFLNLAIVRRN